jgi:hypothetical protein
MSLLGTSIAVLKQPVRIKKTHREVEIMNGLNKAVLVGLLSMMAIAGIASETGADGVKYLFVQSAQSLKVNEGKIILKNVDESAIYFSDRPERIAGHMSIEKFVDIWSEGDESFKLSNPNAALSFLDDENDEIVIVVLSKPVLKSGNLTYDVTVLDGVLPAKGGACSLFIDVIGRPRSPGSIAGIARRTTVRHVVVGNSIAKTETADAYDDARAADARADEAEAEAREAKAKAATTTAAPAATATTPPKHSPEEKMEQLNKMFKEGYLSEDECDKKKQEILSSF